ncbi:hypothetical protein [Methylocystis echinoides]|uniref:Uncharacterized protein n=1 Tax=Methylocystis echinoides TaxID=29468 RepID=A0A9W6GTN7_9HYPH|nr:hypothetical protein [Methylocystis echinoides]GLI92749.1 hypothetical protein LMG27198_17410 [Methylocystis echinoides]
MPVLLALFVACILFGAIRRAARFASSSTITVTVTEIRRGDDGRDPPEAPIVPRDEPEVIAAKRRLMRSLRRVVT